MDWKGYGKQLNPYIYVLYLGISLEGLNKIIRKLTQDSQCLVKIKNCSHHCILLLLYLTR